MKKTLIAMAVLAASGASMAQVTLYGVVGGQLQSQKTEATGAADVKADGFGNIGAIGGGRFGMRGTEDLGGGLSANFALEATANTSDGTVTSGTGTQNTTPTGTTNSTVTSQLFNRQSWAGVSGGFGAVRLGRSKTPFNETIDVSDPFETTGLSAVGLDGAQTPSGRANNSLFYATPNVLGGFVVKALYGKWDTSGATPADTTNTGLSVGYSAGPLAVSLGFGDLETVTATTAKTDGQALSATYDFGVAKLFAGWATTEAKSNTAINTYTEDEEFNIGVTVPMGAVTLLAGLGRNSRTYVVNGVETGSAVVSSNLTGTGDGNDWVLGAYYNLSKRTVAYVKTGVTGKFDFDGGASRETTGSAIGIRHAF
jgi:predicted porin